MKNKQMKVVIFLISLMTAPAFAKAPECPLFPDRKTCLRSTEENYKNFLDFIEEEYNDPKDELIQAAVDIKHFETLACEKTCLN